MSKEMKIKSVAFNLTDPFELKLYNHTQQFTVFSAYMKRLVQRDLEGNAISTKTKEITLESSVEGFI